MSGFKIFLSVFLIFALSVFAQNQSEPKNKITYSQEEIKQLQEEYRLALTMFKRGSYYSALNILSKILNKRDNPYYNDALFLSAKIYLRLGRKTGLKELLQKALYYINIYTYSAKEPFNCEYYYIKGNIYENLYMYERALAMYKMAFSQAKDKKQQFKTVIAILRTAAWIKRLDIVTRYIILVNLEELSEKEKKEFEFVKGLVEFEKGNYKKAFKYLIPVYKEYEQYLIENPDYYLIIGENAYRLGDYTFAKQIFRRMVSLVKDETVIRKALLRLGDIAEKTGDSILAFNYYYRVLQKYPGTQEATVAKLKLISLAENPQIKKKLLRSEDKDFKDPESFVIKTLVLNRNNYIGFFALGNFGVIAFKSGSQEILKKLSWELSLVNVSRMRYEHIEYIRNLWKPHIKNIKYMHVCSLYVSNEEFFLKVFDIDTLKVVYEDLKKCGKYKDALDLAKNIFDRWRDDRSVLLLADAYFSVGDYRKSLTILEKVKKKNCEYYLLFAKNIIFLKKRKPEMLDRIKSLCTDSTEKYVILSYLYLENGNIKEALKSIKKVEDQFPDYYLSSSFGKVFFRKLIYTLFENSMYSEALKILKRVSEKIKEDCDINSWMVIALIRTDKEEILNDYIQRINNCNTQWSVVAKNLFEDYTVIRGFKNE